jgi:hypothetical protein
MIFHYCCIESTCYSLHVLLTYIKAASYHFYLLGTHTFRIVSRKLNVLSDIDLYPLQHFVCR